MDKQTKFFLCFLWIIRLLFCYGMNNSVGGGGGGDDPMYHPLGQKVGGGVYIPHPI